MRGASTAAVVGSLWGLACAAGSGDDGLSGAASLGQNTDGAATLGANDGANDTDGATSAASVGANDGDEPEPPTNPNEDCNGLDDDGNGLIDDGLGEIGCGSGMCFNVVPACEGGVPNPCEPLPPQGEVCNGLDDDCDGSVDEGVAATACSSACGGGFQACVAGALAECDAPQPSAEACNTIDDDCNGQIDENVAGCRVGVHRTYKAATGEHFYTASLVEAQNAGFVIEYENYFWLYANAQPGTVALYRCWVPPLSMHFYTTSPTCDGYTVEGVLGHIGTSGFAGGTELYRAYNPGTGDHFYTTSLPEFNAATSGGGYVGEGSRGYVW